VDFHHAGAVAVAQGAPEIRQLTRPSHEFAVLGWGAARMRPLVLCPCCGQPFEDLVRFGAPGRLGIQQRHQKLGELLRERRVPLQKLDLFPRCDARERQWVSGGEASGQCLVEDHPHGVPIGGGREVDTPKLLGRHVGECSGQLACGALCDPELVDGRCQVEVENDDATVRVDPHVGGLHVAVKAVRRMQCGEAVCELRGRFVEAGQHCVTGVAAGIPAHVLDEIGPVHELHGETADILTDHEVLKLDQVGMIDPRRSPVLLLQFVDPLRRTFLDHLECNDALELGVEDAVDTPHAAAPDKGEGTKTCVPREQGGIEDSISIFRHRPRPRPCQNLACAAIIEDSWGPGQADWPLTAALDPAIRWTAIPAASRAPIGSIHRGKTLYLTGTWTHFSQNALRSWRSRCDLGMPRDAAGNAPPSSASRFSLPSTVGRSSPSSRWLPRRSS